MKTINAGNSSVYEIVEALDKPFNVIIRNADNKREYYELPKSVLHLLGSMLIEIYNEYDEEINKRKK